MRKVFSLISLILFISSLGLSASFELSDRALWEKGEFNGTFYNESDGVTMGYSNESSSLEALWRFNIDSSQNGGEFKDYSSNEYYAQSYGGISSTEGILSSKAVRLDGSDDYIAIKDKKYTEQGQIGEITVCSWVKSSDSQTGYGNFIASYDRSEYWRFSFVDDSSSSSYIA